MDNDFILVNMKNYNNSMPHMSYKKTVYAINQHASTTLQSISSTNEFTTILDMKSTDIYKSIIDNMACILQIKLCDIISKKHIKKSKAIRKQFNVDAPRSLMHINNNKVANVDDVLCYLGPIASLKCIDLALLLCTQTIYAPIVSAIQPPIETDMYVSELGYHKQRLFLNHLFTKDTDHLVFESIKNLGLIRIKHSDIRQVAEFSIYLSFDIPLQMKHFSEVSKKYVTLEISPNLRRRDQFPT